MHAQQLSANEYLLVFTEPDVEVMAALSDFAATNGVGSGRFQAIGSVSAATLAWWSADTKAVEKFTATGQFELVSLMGNITANTEGPRIHAHAVLTGPSGLVAGHAVSLTVRASVEVSMTVFETPASRAYDDRFGLWIITPPA